MKTKTFFCSFFKYSFIRRVGAVIFELNEVSISNFVRFQLQSMSSKIERAFEKITKLSIKIGPKRTIVRQLKRTINQCKVPYMRKKHIFCKNVSLCTINNLSVALEIFFS